MRTKIVLTGILLGIVILSSLTGSAQVIGDYRTKTGGDWKSLSVWERFNGVSWAVPTAAEGSPDTSAASITISHQITVTHSTVVNKLTVQKDAVLIISPGSKLSISGSAGSGLYVSGIVVNGGDLETTGNAVFEANAVYRHQQTKGRLPEAATWDPNSLVEFNHKGAINPEPVKKSVAFGRMLVRKNSSVTLDGEAGSAPLKISFANGENTDLVIEDEATLKLGGGVDSFILSKGVSAEVHGILENKSRLNFIADDNVMTISSTGVLENEGEIVNAGYSKLLFAKGALYEHKQDGGTVPNAKWDKESDCRITGLKKIYPDGMNQVFGNLEFNVALAAEIALPGSLDCEGDLIFSNSTGYKFIVNKSDKHQTLFVGGNLFLNSGNFYVAFSKGKGSVNVGKDYIQESSINLFLKSDSGDASLFVSNDFSKKGGNILLRSRDTAAIDGMSLVSVRRNYHHQGGVINFSPIGGTSYLEVGGDYTNIGQLSEYGDGSGEVIFNGKSIQYLYSGGNALNEINFTVKEGAYLQFATPASIIVSGGSFTAKTGSTLGIKHFLGILNENTINGQIRTQKRKYEDGIHFIYNGISAQVAGDGFYDSQPASLTIDNPYYLSIQKTSKVQGNVQILDGQLYTSNGAELIIGGNWINDGKKADQRNASVVFEGKQIQSIGGGQNTVFGSLTVSNNSGVALLNNTDVFNNIRLLAGIVYLNDFNLTLYPNVNAIEGAPFGVQNMFVTSGKGELRKQAVKAGQADFLFPVGDTTGNDQYTPVSLQFTGGQYNGYLSVSVTNAKHPQNPSNENYLNRYWTIHQTGFTGFNAKVITTFDSSDVQGKKDFIQMAKFNGENDSIPWVASGIVPSGNNLIYENVTSFSDFTGIGIIIAPALPKRSISNLSSNSVQDTERMMPDGAKPAIKIYPNPVQGTQVALIMVNIKPGRYQMVISNNLGQRVYSSLIEHSGGTITTRANLLNVPPAGIYRVQLISEKEKYNTTYLQQ